MSKTLGAVCFVHNGLSLDYNIKETIENMKAFADQVVVLDAGSTDGTDALCRAMADEKTKVICLSEDEWNAQRGKEKLSYFQNKAKKHLTTDYYMVIQADEILHHDSFHFVRHAMTLGMPAFMCKRVNLWFDPYHELIVPQERKPCSTEVIRLATLEFNSIGDGESFDCPEVCFDYIDHIRIYHLGFVRDRKIMKVKVTYMQERVFETPHDARLDEDSEFNPHRYFNIDTDVRRIDEPLPIHIQEWAEKRYPGLS